jgi:dihydrodipicolinate synthase/N-acetylneuraminate lyase
MEQPSKKNLADGVYAALATPRRKGSAEPDTAGILDYVDAVAQAGVDGVLLFGSTGEFVHFDIADRIHNLNLAIRRSRVPVLVNVSHSTLDGSALLADDAVERGAAGLLLMPPYFFQYSESDIEEFYLRFADSVEGRVPIYLYNIPPVTNRMSAALALRLLATGLFAGIKDSSGEWEMFDALNRERNNRAFQIFIGNEIIYVRARYAGSSGTISGVTAALPELVVSLDRAIRAGKKDSVEKLNKRLMEFLNPIQKFPATVAIKQAAVARGWALDHFAVPPGEVNRAELDRYRDWLKDWIPAVLKECALA